MNLLMKGAALAPPFSCTTKYSIDVYSPRPPDIRVRLLPTKPPVHFTTGQPGRDNQDKQRDPDAHQVKKGNEWHFGYKAHIGVDKDSGLVHTLKVTAANVHDVTMTSKLLTGEETVVYGDSGYLGAEKREDAIITNHSGKHIRYKINRRPSQMKKGSARSQAQLKRREHEKSSVRAKVEHVFGVVKGLFRYRKTRYRGLRKQTAKLNMLFALANLILADRRCLPA